MGRPINKRYIGNTSQSGQQIQATAYFGGEPGPVTAYINKQVATNTYQMTSEDGTASGRVQLAQGGVALNPGQANVIVTPYGASGSGVVASARMKTAGGTVYLANGGSTYNDDYNVGDVLTLVGGSNTTPATFTVDTINTYLIGLDSVPSGYNYNVGNRITFGGAGWISNAVVSVSTVDATGAITSFAQLTTGVRSGAALSTMTGSTLQGTSGNADVSGTDAVFKVRWGVASISQDNPGVFSTLPANPVATTTDGVGVGATVNCTWQVNSVVVSNGGSDFDGGAAVSFTPAGAAATATVNAAGSISGITVTNSGPAVNAVPTVAVGPLNTVQYAQEIRNRTVWTFDMNTFEWIMEDQDLVSSNQARIQSA